MKHNSLKANGADSAERAGAAGKSPATILQACRDRWEKNEAGYRRTRHEIVAKVYGQSLRLLEDEEARDEFYGLSYWKGHRMRQTDTERDFFRDVFEFVLDAKTMASKKLASKYSGVMIELRHADVEPEHAASRILLDGGIEAIHRRGVVRRKSLALADQGDGMDARGNPVAYHEEADEEPEEPAVDFINLKLLADFEPKAGIKVVIRATRGFGLDGVIYTIKSVRGVEAPAARNDPKPTGDASVPTGIKPRATPGFRRVTVKKSKVRGAGNGSKPPAHGPVMLGARNPHRDDNDRNGHRRR